jgi:beta-lactamase regulating signal transducer with metallopeptidase domain
MNYLSYILFIVALSGLNFIGLLLTYVFEITKAPSSQKIKLLKLNLILTGLSPLFYIFYKKIYWNTLSLQFSNIQIPHNLIIAPAKLPITTNVDWSFYIVIFYLMGITIMLIKILLSYLDAKKLLENSIATTIQSEIVYLNKNIETPLSFGIFQPKIYLPMAAQQKFTQRELQMSIAHEKTHIQQKDPLWKLFSLAVQEILFFAPWSYVFHRKLELETEIICDEITCKNAKADPNEYGTFLLTMIDSNHNPIYTNLTTSTLKRRILSMKSKHIKRPLLIWVFGIIILLTNSITLATSSGILEKDSVFDISSKIFIDGKLISNPRIIAKANQLAAISISDKPGTNSLKMQLIAKEKSKDTITIKFDIQYKNGNEHIETKPEFMLSPNQEGVIKLANSGHLYEMHVIAKKQ